MRDEKPRALVLFERSLTMALALVDEGFIVTTVDISPPLRRAHGVTSHQIDMSNVSVEHLASLDPNGFDLVIAFPPCTDLASSGARWWRSKLEENQFFQIEAMHLARLAEEVADITGALWAVENPVGALSTLWRKPDWIFDPCEFGGYLPKDDTGHPMGEGRLAPRDSYNKRTCIWTNFDKPETCPVNPTRRDSIHTVAGNGGSRSKLIRSLTPRGFAIAIAKQARLEIG